MPRRRRIVQSSTLNNRLSAMADLASRKAAALPAGPERDALKQKAELAEKAIAITKWLATPRAQFPT